MPQDERQVKRKLPMRVFVYEYFTANAIGREPDSPDHGIYREGRAMRDAAGEDFGRIPCVEVIALPDENAPIDPDWFEGMARSADWTLVISPESNEMLACEAQLAEAAGGRLLGPSVAAIGLTSDKFALAEHWRSHAVPIPATTDREPTACEAFPLVWKPRDGAGSTATFRLNSQFDLASAKAQLISENHRGAMILQEFVPGRAASVAFLCGPAGNVPLIPCFQHLSDEGRFRYRGGELPISSDLAQRAVRLGQRAVDCVSGLLGYVGVDLVLGDAEDGSRAFAMEINPRLSTSY